MKKLVSATLFFMGSLMFGQNLSKHSFGMQVGSSNLQTDYGTSETFKSQFANFGSSVEVDYYYNLFDLFRLDSRSTMYNWVYSHLILHGKFAYHRVNMDYHHVSDGDPIFTGEQFRDWDTQVNPDQKQTSPGKQEIIRDPISGTANIYSVGASLEYNFTNMTRYYYNRSKFAFSPFIGVGVSYNFVNPNTNAYALYDEVYGNNDGVISSDERPSGLLNRVDYPQFYNENDIMMPIPEKLLNDFGNAIYASYPDPSDADQRSKAGQLFRYAGMTRPEQIRSLSLDLIAGIRFKTSDRLEFITQGVYQLFDSDDIDGMNLPWTQNEFKETAINITVGIVYRPYFRRGR